MNAIPEGWGGAWSRDAGPFVWIPQRSSLVSASDLIEFASPFFPFPQVYVSAASSGVLYSWVRRTERQYTSIAGWVILLYVIINFGFHMLCHIEMVSVFPPFLDSDACDFHVELLY